MRQSRLIVVIVALVIAIVAAAVVISITTLAVVVPVNAAANVALAVPVFAIGIDDALANHAIVR
jgi:hypothetical protein